MVKRHLKRLAAPKSWPIKRKTTKFIVRPMPGAHNLNTSIPLAVLIKEVLNYAKTIRETKRILNNDNIKVDNILRKDYKLPVGLMDVISIKGTNENFRILISKRGKLTIHPIKKEESLIKPFKITGKRTIKGKKIQITFHDGRNKIIKDNKFKVGDTLVLDLEKKDVKDHLELKKGMVIYLTAGKHKGNIGVIKEIQNLNSIYPNKVIFTKGKETLETLKDNVFVIGKDKPCISLGKENE